MKLTDYAALAQLASAHLRPGVRANTMVSQTEYGASLAGGTLTAQETPAGLLLLLCGTVETIPGCISSWRTSPSLWVPPSRTLR